jgi:hypothetical protein
VIDEQERDLARRRAPSTRIAIPMAAVALIATPSHSSGGR